MQSLDKLIAETMERGRAVGLALSVFNQDGRTIYEKFCGHRDKEKGLPVDGDTVFGLASVSKSFLALSVMQLQDAGLLDIHKSIRAVAPELTCEGMTLAHVMSHSAGILPLPRTTVGAVAEELGLTMPADGDFAYNAAIAARGAEILRDKLNGQTRFTGAVGENFSYSNDCYSYAGHIVSRLGGAATFAEYVKAKVLAPLGMSRSGGEYLWDDDNVSILYRELPPGSGEIVGTADFTDNSVVLMGNGGLKSTVNDMKKYICMHLNRGKGLNGARIASSYAIGEMAKPRQVTGLNEYYGYGLSIEALGDITMVSHGGSVTGVSANMAWSREIGVGVVVLCNTSGVNVGAIAEAALGMANESKTGPTWSDELWAKVCGEYASDEGVSLKIARDGDELTIEMMGFTLRGRPINNYMFKTDFRGTPLTIQVMADDDGEVWALFMGLRILLKVK